VFPFKDNTCAGIHWVKTAQVNHLAQAAAKENVDAGGHGEPSEKPRNSVCKG